MRFQNLKSLGIKNQNVKILAYRVIELLYDDSRYFSGILPIFDRFWAKKNVKCYPIQNLSQI